MRAETLSFGMRASNLHFATSTNNYPKLPYQRPT